MGMRDGWPAAVGLALAGILLLSCLPQRLEVKLTPWLSDWQMELSAPADQGLELELELRRPAGRWASEGRWLVEISGQAGEARLVRPLSRRKMTLRIPAGEGIQVRLLRLPTPNSTL